MKALGGTSRRVGLSRLVPSSAALWRTALATTLAALVVASACLAPLHERAMLQALASEQVAELTPVQAGLTLEATTLQTDEGGLPVSVPVDDNALLASVPNGVRERLEPPVITVETSVALRGEGQGGRSTVGGLLWREGMCERLVFTTGTCPTKPREIAVSAADAERFGWTTGAVVRVTENSSSALISKAPGRIRLRVAGVFRQADLAWWDGRVLTGRSGLPNDPQGATLLHDTFLASEPSIRGATRVRWFETRHRFDLRPRAGQLGDVDRVRSLADGVGAVAADDGLPYSARAASSLPEVGESLDRAEGQTGLIVPVLVVQMLLVGLVALVLCLQSDAVRLRPQVGLLRLRGYDVRRARRFVLSRLLPAVLPGVPLGMALALLLGWALRRWLLTGSPPLETPSAFWLIGLAAAVVLAATVLVVAHATARLPVVDLLPRSGVNRRPRAVGAVTVVIVTGAVILDVALLSGELTGPIALLAPGVTALAAGLLIARLSARVASRVGGALLDRGRMGGLALLQFARRTTSAHTVALATVATSLFVFAATASVLADDNREAAAVQELGAGARVTLADPEVVAASRAAAAADPEGSRATVVTSASTADGAATLAVRPDEFAQVAALSGLDGVRGDLAELTPSPVPPLVIRGERLTTETALFPPPRQGSVPINLRLDVVPSGGPIEQIDLGRVEAGVPQPVEVEIPCRLGCRLVSVTARIQSSQPAAGEIRVGPLVVGGQAVGLGVSADWVGWGEGGYGQLAMTVADDGSSAYTLQSYGSSALVAHHASVPEELPSLVTSGSAETPLTARTLGGDYWTTQPLAKLDRLPGTGPGTSIVDLDALSLSGQAADGDTVVEIWLRDADPDLIAAVQSALTDEGVQVASVTSLADTEQALDRSVPAWSFDLAVVIGLAGLLLGGIGLLVVGVSARDARARDLAALGLLGNRPTRVRRLAFGEQLPAVLVAVLIGGACGAFGAGLALRSVPFLADPPAVDTTDLSTPWPVVAAAAVIALVVVTACLAWTARRTARAAVGWNLRRMR